MKLIYISVAVSLDGYIDDANTQRLLLSSPEDIADRNIQRAACDAILVGANTIRRDNPSLRIENGTLTRVTITRSGNLDSSAKFFAADGTRRIVLCPQRMADGLRARLGDIAEIVAIEAEITPFSIVAALENRGVDRLFIEGGTAVLTAFIAAGLFHHLRVAVAPFFVGDTNAPRFVGAGKFLYDPSNRLRLVKLQQLGDMSVMEYENDPDV